MASTPPSASDIRRIVREELQPVETRFTAKIETEIGELKEMPVGVVDEDFPPVDRATGSPARTVSPWDTSTSRT